MSTRYDMDAFKELPNFDVLHCSSRKNAKIVIQGGEAVNLRSMCIRNCMLLWIWIGGLLWLFLRLASWIGLKALENFACSGNWNFWRRLFMNIVYENAFINSTWNQTGWFAQLNKASYSTRMISEFIYYLVFLQVC